MGLTCVIDGGFEQEQKRRKMYQLQRETEQLRDRIRESSGDHVATATASPDIGESDNSRWQSAQSLLSDASSSTQTLPRMIDGLVLESTISSRRKSMPTSIQPRGLPMLMKQVLERLCRINPSLRFFHSTEWLLPTIAQPLLGNYRCGVSQVRAKARTRPSTAF